MKLFKKIVFLIFALLPIITFLFNALFYMSANDNTQYPFKNDGQIIIESTTDQNRVIVRLKENSIAEKCFFDIFGYSNYTGKYVPNGETETFSSWAFNPGLANTFLRFLMLLNNAGMPISTSSTIVCFYICYLITLELIMMLYQIIIFIPRKCSEIFGG